jgi:hypothetical protein
MGSLITSEDKSREGQPLCPSFGVAVRPPSRLERQHGASPGNEPSAVLAEHFDASKGLVMLIRGQIDGFSAKAVLAAAPAVWSLPTLLIGGLLLICP